MSAEPLLTAPRSILVVQRWWLWGGAFLLPLAYLPGTYDGYVLPKLLLARIVLIGLAILFVARTWASGQPVVKRTAVDLPLVAFLLSAAASTIFAFNQNIAIFGTYARYDGLLTLLTYAGLFWFTVQSLAEPGEARALLRVMLVSGYVVATLAVLQAIGAAIQARSVMSSDAVGTLGNTNVLAAYLAMLCPLAFGELAAARSAAARILAANALTMMAFAELLTFSRSAWLGLMAAALVLVISSRPWSRRPAPQLIGFAAVVVVVLALLVAGRGLTGGHDLEHALEEQARTLVQPGALASSRLNIWRDSVSLIANRPLLGYGPDNFGLVFSTFQTGDYGVGADGVRRQFDKAHAEILQVAATQGLIGVAAYLWMLAAFVGAFWRGRARAGAVVMFAGWLAYQVTIQFNFTTLAAAFPFWMFAAAALTSLETGPATSVPIWGRGRLESAVGALLIAGLTALAVPAVVLPYLADASLLSAVKADGAGRRDEARVLAADTRRYGPRESVYAVEVGNLAYARGDIATARAEFMDAAGLGTYNPSVYVYLALADRDLGLLAEAKAAAKKAVELDRFDPAYQALLAQFQAT